MKTRYMIRNYNFFLVTTIINWALTDTETKTCTYPVFSGPLGNYNHSQVENEEFKGSKFEAVETVIFS